jgi:hypothetical protein
MRTDGRLQFGPFSLILPEPSQAVHEFVTGGRLPPEAVLSKSDLGDLNFQPVLGDAVEKRLPDGTTLSYANLEDLTESAEHAAMRRLVAKLAARSGLRVYPEAIGAENMLTLADLLIADHETAAFVECLTAPRATPEVLERKLQLNAVAPLLLNGDRTRVGFERVRPSEI